MYIAVTRSRYKNGHGGFDYRTRNTKGESILDFALSYDLWVTNTWFKKRYTKLMTFRTRVNATQIDYFLTRMLDRSSCLDC